MDYDALKQKHQLPDIEIIDFEFEIDRNAKFILREIRRKIHEKLGACAEIIEGILQPDTNSFPQMYETAYFDESEKTKVMRTYRKIMKLIRESAEAGLKCSDEEDAKFILEALKEWNEIKENTSSTAEKLKNSWANETESESDLRYMG
jgi:protein subunit release factor A